MKLYHLQRNIATVVQLLGHVWLSATPWTTACQASLSFTVSLSLLKHTSIESMMPSNHLILCHPLLLLPSVFPNIRVFSSESALHIRWPKNWITVLCNLMKLWAMPCRATQDRWVMMKSSNKMWSTGEGKGKPPQHSCLENPMNSMKRWRYGGT